MKIVSIIVFLLISFVSKGQFIDTAALNQYIRDTIKDRRPAKVTAEQLQKVMLGIIKLFPSTSEPSNPSIITVNRDTTLGPDNYTVLGNTNDSALIITLPSAASAKGRIYNIKRNGTNQLIIDALNDERIDGSLVKTIISTRLGLTLQSDGTMWMVIASYTSPI